MSESKSSKKKKSILKGTEADPEVSSDLPLPQIQTPEKAGKKKKKEPVDPNSQPRSSGFFRLQIPSFLGGGSGSKDNLKTSGSNISSNASILTSISEHQTRNRVRFTDRLSVRSISAINISEVVSYDGDKKKTTDDHLKNDPGYLPGFVDLYYSKEITIKEKTRCHWRSRTLYQIVNETDDNIYIVEKYTEPLSTLAKFLCFFAMDVMRVGFKISVYNKSVSAKLITFRRHSHWFAEQLDIVEIFYSIEDAHVGRIEKTVEGFRIVNARGTEMYRVLRDTTSEKKLTSTKCTLVIFSGEKRTCLGKIVYFKRSVLAKAFPLCINKFKHVIKWSPEMEVTAKVMLIGVLFLELHSNESFVDLPLGSDATSSTLFRYHRA